MGKDRGRDLIIKKAPWGRGGTWASASSLAAVQEDTPSTEPASGTRRTPAS